MSTQELRALGKTELLQKVEELKRDLFKLRLQKTVGQLKTTHVLKAKRREVAQIKTVLNDLGV